MLPYPAVWQLIADLVIRNGLIQGECLQGIIQSEHNVDNTPERHVRARTSPLSPPPLLV
jgi:hypothetical protein